MPSQNEQYKKLEELQKTYGDRGFTVLGFPSNQFLQEVGSSEAIKDFCSVTYGVTSPMFEEIRVNGRSQHPLYAVLTRTADAEGKAGKAKWNFEKFVHLARGRGAPLPPEPAGADRWPVTPNGGSLGPTAHGG